MIITQALLDSISELAKASPRLRMNYDLRNSFDKTGIKSNSSSQELFVILLSQS